MLDPRIYRAGFVPVALAVIALAFSLSDQQGPAGTNLAPDAFNAQNTFAQMTGLGVKYPNRRPGSVGDRDLADEVATGFNSDGLNVSRRVFSARTAEGTKKLETVLGTRAGSSNRRIVIVAHRDAMTSPATAELSGTATLLQLAHILSERTLHSTVVLASTSGSVGAAGASELAGTLGGPVDAVLVLGDLVSAQVRGPVVVPWSSGQYVAPPMLRNTVAAALGAQTGLPPGGTSLSGQLARLALPLSLSEQGPFDGQGESAVLLSASGELGPAPGAQPSLDRLTGFGRTALQTISALDDGPTVPAPGAYLLVDRKVVPAWAIRLLVLALILPVLGVTIDGFARARRRGHAVGPSILRVLAGSLPFFLPAALLLGLRVTGLLKVAPPGAVGAAVVPLHTAGVAVLIAVCLVLVLTGVGLRRFIGSLAVAGPAAKGPPSTGGAIAVLLVLCGVSLAIWVLNPFAAALLVVAIHLWMWVVAPEVRISAPVKAVMVLLGLAPIALVLVYYASTFGLGPLDVAWSAVMLIAGQPAAGFVGVAAWSIVLGCLVGVVVVAARATRDERLEDSAPVTVRGPITYAGPGSLGGTESALRR
jgi:hypothetical protein